MTKLRAGEQERLELVVKGLNADDATLKIDYYELNLVIHKISDEVVGEYVLSLEELQGITFYTHDASKRHLFAQEKKCGLKRIPQIFRTGTVP